MSELIFNYPEQAQPVNIAKDTFSLENFNKKNLTRANNLVKQDKFEKNIIKILRNMIDEGKRNGNDIVESYRKNYNNTYDCYHGGYLQYLYCAYVQDLGIEIAPWYLWNVIFHQVCQIIKQKENEEKFKHIFTKNDKKITLTFLQEEIDIAQYTSEIKKLIPNEENYNKFFPIWSHTPELYNESMQGLFADMVQNYYGCLIMECSLPAVRILGTSEDWLKLHQSVLELNDLLHIDYLIKVSKYTEKLSIEWSNENTWKNFFKITHCGSGHQESLIGDFRKLLNYSEKSELLTSQLQNTMSRFPFENKNNILHLSNGENEMIECKDCFFNAGIVGSNIQIINDIHFLIPQYDYSITFVDLTKLYISTNDVEKYMDLINKVSMLNKLNNISLRNHFTYKQKSFNPKENFDFNKLLSDKEVEILVIEDDKLKIEKLNFHLNKLLEYHNNKAIHYENSRFEFADDRKKIKTLEDIKKEFDIRVKNGRPYHFMEQMEKQRIDNLKTDYNIWFKKYTNIIGKEVFAFASMKNCILKYDDYIENLDEARLCYNFLIDFENFKIFYNEINIISNNYRIDYDLENVILHTLDIQVYHNYLMVLTNNINKRSFVIKVANICGLYGFPNNSMTKIFSIDEKIKKELLKTFDELFIEEYRKIVEKPKN